MIEIKIDEINDLTLEGRHRATRYIIKQTERVTELLKDYSNVSIHSFITAKSATIFSEIHFDTPEEIRAYEIPAGN
jgi:hypothetical protein